MSGEVVLMTLLGGMGTIFGPVVGAFAIIGLESYLASFGQWVTVITGVIFVVCVLAFRRGIVGELGAWWASRKVGRWRSPWWRPRAAGARGRAGPGRRRQLPRRPAARRVRAAQSEGPGARRRRLQPRQAHRQLPVLVEPRRAHRAASLRRGRAVGNRSPCGMRTASEPPIRRRKLEAGYAQGLLSGIKRSWYPDGRLRAELRYDKRPAGRGARVWRNGQGRCPTPRPARSRRATSTTDEQFYASLDSIIRARISPRCEPASDRLEKELSALSHRCGAGARLQRIIALL